MIQNEACRSAREVSLLSCGGAGAYQDKLSSVIQANYSNLDDDDLLVQFYRDVLERRDKIED